MPLVLHDEYEGPLRARGEYFLTFMGSGWALGGEGQSYRPFHNSAQWMDAICIQVKHWLFLNSTSFIQMNDGPRNSTLCCNINIHQRPAPLTKSGNHQHLLFKWQTAAAGAERTERTQKKRWTNQFRFQSGKDTRPRAMTLMNKGSSTGPSRHNGCCSVPPLIGSTSQNFFSALNGVKGDFPSRLDQKMF